MCPKEEYLSAFIDGEIESPWNKKIEQHIISCQKCQKKLESLQSLQHALRKDQALDYLAPMKRVKQRIDFNLAESSFKTRYAPLTFWQRKIAIPMPALVMLSLVILILVASVSFFIGRHNNQILQASSESYGPQSVHVSIPIKDLELLLQLLNNQDFKQEVIMELPGNSEFTVIGEPIVIRENDLNHR